MAVEWMSNVLNEWEESLDVQTDRKKNKRRCIYRVPEFMKNIRKDCYTPQVVSLGPYHHDSPQLKHMEEIKLRILGYYLAKIEKTLNEAMQALKREVRRLMDAYDRLEDPWTDEDKFVQLMVVDACLLLELHLLMNGMEDDEELRRCYEEILSVLFTINVDIMLLENQVPLRALQIMADLGGDQVSTKNVPLLLLKNEIDDHLIINYDTTKFHHKLHAVWVSRLMCNSFLFKSTSEREINPPTVRELVEAGVRIEKADSTSINFSNGVLALPHIKFIDDLGYLYHNLMAFEKMHNLDPEFFSFLEFMDCIIDTPADVAILRRRRVIGGGIASDRMVAEFFNWVTRNAYPPERKLRTEGEDVAKRLYDYCRKWQNRWPASFRHLYLENPWTFISLIGAVLLLALTILATVYSILQYYKK